MVTRRIMNLNRGPIACRPGSRRGISGVICRVVVNGRGLVPVVRRLLIMPLTLPLLMS